MFGAAVKKAHKSPSIETMLVAIAVVITITVAIDSKPLGEPSWPHS
mgnify:CR=1 FL=1